MISALSYPNLRVTPAQAADSLRQLRRHLSAGHQFWAEDASLTDKSVFNLSSSKQTADAYLAGLAFHHAAQLATLAAGMAWKAVRGATGNLLDLI